MACWLEQFDDEIKAFQSNKTSVESFLFQPKRVLRICTRTIVHIHPLGVPLHLQSILRGFFQRLHPLSHFLVHGVSAVLLFKEVYELP